VNCHDAKDLLHAYVDGELDLVRNLDMEQHLHSCPACAAAAKNARSLKSAISGAGLYFHPAPAVRRQILATIGELAQPVGVKLWWRNWLNWAALAATCLAISGSSLYYYTRPTANDRLLQEVRAGHVRSLMTRHLVDVASTNRAEVAPFFEGKLDFAPKVAELGAAGFSLVGARLDFLGDRPMAALVYQRDDRVMNVFIWRMSCEEIVPDKPAELQGLNLVQWSETGIGFAMVSDAATDVLKKASVEFKK
jgi:anti-sigma factor RsiW